MTVYSLFLIIIIIIIIMIIIIVYKIQNNDNDDNKQLCTISWPNTMHNNTYVHGMCWWNTMRMHYYAKNPHTKTAKVIRSIALTLRTLLQVLSSWIDCCFRANAASSSNVIVGWSSTLSIPQIHCPAFLYHGSVSQCSAMMKNNIQYHTYVKCSLLGHRLDGTLFET